MQVFGILIQALVVNFSMIDMLQLLVMAKLNGVRPSFELRLNNKLLVQYLTLSGILKSVTAPASTSFSITDIKFCFIAINSGISPSYGNHISIMAHSISTDFIGDSNISSI